MKTLLMSLLIIASNSLLANELCKDGYDRTIILARKTESSLMNSQIYADSGNEFASKKYREIYNKSREELQDLRDDFKENCL